MPTAKTQYDDETIIRTLLDMYLFNKYCPNYDTTERLFNIFECDDYISYKDVESDTEEFDLSLIHI